MLVANIKRILGLGSLLVLFLSTNLAIELKAAEAAGVVNRYAALSQAEKNTALLVAAEIGRLEVVRLLLAAGANVNAQSQDGYMALMWAAFYGHFEVVRLLLAAGADVNAQSQDGHTALMLAARDGHAGIVQLLLAAGVNVNAQNQGDDTALMFAAREDQVEVVRLLLAAEADVNAQSQAGFTALMDAAALNGRAEVVRLLLAAGANVNAQNQGDDTALMFAARKGQVEVVRLLLAAEADVNAQSQAGFTALMWAAVNGHADVVRLLLAAEADVNAQNQAGSAALMWAATNGHAEVVRLLLAAEAELPAASRISVAANATIQTVLAELEARKAEFLAAAAAGNLAKVNELIELPIRDRKLVINQALLALAGNNIPAADFKRVLAKLLAHGADIDAMILVNTGGAIEGKGADLHTEGQELRTALDLAILANEPDCVDALLMAGANPEKLSDSTKDRLASADVADITLKDNLLIIAKMIQDANMALAMLISPKIFKTFAHSIEESLAAEYNTLDPVLRYLYQWEAQADDRKKRAERARILAIPVPR